MIRRFSKSRLLLGLGLMFAVVLVAVACSSDDGLTKEELQEALAAQQPAAAPAGPSAAEISALVSAAVADAVPEGVSSADVAAAVEAAVASASSEGLTAADVEALVSKAVEDAVSGGPTPLTPAQIEAIVAAGIAAIPAPEIADTPSLAGSPFITADPQGGNVWPSIVLNNVPSSFQEAPMLAALVASGDLPPVEERLPTNPLVISPADGIGKYGGTWFRAFTGPADGQNMERPMKDHLLYFDTGMTDVQPNIAESWTVNADATVFTFTLRTGLKWSDGNDFTTEDIMFWYNQMLLNDEINPTTPAWAVHGGETLLYEKIDDVTFRVTAAKPYGLFIQLIASVIVAGPHTRGDSGGGGYAPSHYLQQFHPDFVGLATANANAEAAGFDNWSSYFLNRNHANANPDAPMMTAWRVTQSINTSEWAFERNPYYYAVDTDGNQLPYMDKVVLTLAENLEVLNLRAIAGDFTVMGRHIDIAKLPVFLENATAADYRVQFWKQPQSGIANVSFNESWDGDAELATFLQNVEFRRALSMGIEREQINEVFFLGLGSTAGLCKGFSDPDNPGKYIGEDNVQFNPGPANTALDALGLDKKDSSGFRLLPSGERLTLSLPGVVAAFEDYVGINEMIAQQWKNNLGILAEVQGLERSLHTERAEANELMLQVWESSGRDSVLITPTHLLPVAGALFTDVLGARYFDGRTPSREPVSEFIKEQQVLYAEGISTSDPAVYLANAQRVVEINCEMVNPITTVMNKPTYVAITKNNVRNIPNPLPFSFHAQTSGNGFPETWWLDE
jgi:peptide/nickel transport system substrate-binding protein